MSTCAENMGAVLATITSARSEGKTHGNASLVAAYQLLIEDLVARAHGERAADAVWNAMTSELQEGATS